MRKKSLAALLAISLSGAVHACQLDMGLSSPFNIGREGSLAMAVAMAEARQGGIIKKANPKDDQALTKLRSRLWQIKLQAYQGEKTTFYFYQALDQHWSQISDFAGSTQVSLHRPPRPEMEEGVIVMSHGDVLDVLFNGKLSLAEAENSGLVTITGPSSEGILLVRQWINQSL